MKKHILVVLLLICSASSFAQKEQYFFGISYGRSFPLGDFAANDSNNSDAGFAKNGTKLDVYAGSVLSKSLTFILTFRHQHFGTDIDLLQNDLEATNEPTVFIGNSDSWKTYSLLAGVVYKLDITKKFSLFPRIGLGPMLVSNPNISITATDENTPYGIIRSSETGIGLGYEFGIGFARDLGKNFCLMPAFTFSGGFVTISDVETTVENVTTISNYSPKIFTFNLGVSLAYKF